MRALLLSILLGTVAGCNSRPNAHSTTTGNGALDSVKVLVIAREAVRTNDTWLDRATFETPKQQNDGSWTVLVERLPAEFGGDRLIKIDATGKVTEYIRGL